MMNYGRIPSLKFARVNQVSKITLPFNTVQISIKKLRLNTSISVLSLSFLFVVDYISLSYLFERLSELLCGRLAPELLFALLLGALAPCLGGPELRCCLP